MQGLPTLAIAMLTLQACGRVAFDDTCEPGFLDCDGLAANGCELAIDEPCADDAGCRTGVTTCASGASACELTSTAPIGTPCGNGTSCDADGACSTRTEVVGCGNGPTTGDQLCQRTGFAGATIANGYYWFQCTGFPEHECPGGFDLATLRCTTWCGHLDCAAWPFCGGSETIQEVLGDGATVFDPEAYGRACGPFNPGWLVRLKCHR